MSILPELVEVKKRFGAVGLVFLVSNLVSAELRSELERMAAIVVTERNLAAVVT